MPALKNSRHERFVQELLSGMPVVAAYVKAGYKRDSSTASKVAARPDVQARLEELKEAAALGTVLDLGKTLRYLEKIILTPVDDLTENHEIYEKNMRTGRDGKPVVSLKMPSRLDALEKLIKLRGWYKPQGQVEVPKVEVVDTLTEMLKRVRNG